MIDVKTIYRKSKDANHLLGLYSTHQDYDMLIDYDCDLRDAETGETIIKFRKNVIDKNLITNAFKAVESHTQKISTLRRPYGHSNEHHKTHSNVIGYYVDNIGNNTVRKRHNLYKPFRSNISRWSLAHQQEFDNDVKPMLLRLTELYKQLWESMYNPHMIEARRTEFSIEDTPFSTITINRDWKSFYHKDKKNSPIGVGNLVVYEGSKYEGGFLVFPNYRVAVDVRMGDVLFMNQFKIHGNTDIIKEREDVIGRLSFVSYLHDGLIKDLVHNPSLAQYGQYLYELNEIQRGLSPPCQNPRRRSRR